MLADQLLADTGWQRMTDNPTIMGAFGDEVRAVQRERPETPFSTRLRQAQKFVLDRSLAEVLSEMPRKEIGAAMPFCRLPFPLVWLEVAQQDRPSFRDAFTGIKRKADTGSMTFQPVRVGILCEQQGDDPQRFLVRLAWSYSDADARAQGMGGRTNVCIMANRLDCSTPGAWPDDGTGRGAYTAPFSLDPEVPEEEREALATFEREIPGAAEIIARDANHDWMGEIWFWLAALAMLNAKNGATSEYRPAPEALNRSRAKAGKPPLVDYHQLTLRVGPRDRAEAREGHPHGGMRAHIVRGHFKVRKTGIYWWRPFNRGDASAGFAGKTYKVKL